MDLNRQEYPSMLNHLQPPQAVRILTDRIHHIRTLNVDVADWLQERRRIEEVYAQSLRKLAQKPLGQEDLDLGIFGPPWQKVLSSTKELAQQHQSFAQNIEVDVEAPLRDFATSNQPLRNLSGKIISNLQHTAKEFENATKRSEKLKEKGTKADADRVAITASEIQDAKGQWDSEAPLVFESLQEVDEARWDHLRNSLTQLETYASDMSNSNSTSIQECLGVLLEVQTADEIQHFSMRAPGSVSQLPPSSRRMSQAPPPSFTPSSSLAPPLPAPPADLVSQRSNSIQEKEPKKSKFGGLKRLGTVIKGRRHSTHPYGEPLASPENNVKKRSSTNLTPKLFSRKSKNTGTNSLSPQISREASSSHQSITPRPSYAPLDRPATNQSEREQIPEIPKMSPIDSNLTNGNHTIHEDARPEDASPVAALSPPEEPKTIDPVPSLAGSDAMAQALQEAALVNDANNQFKVDIRQAPIQEEDTEVTAAMANVANTLRASATPRRNNTVRGRRDRNTILVPSPSVPQIPFATAAAASSSSLPNSPGLSPQNTGPSQSLTSPIAAIVPPVAPFKLAHRSTLGTDDGTASDTHSIRSGRSLSSSISTTVRHPDLLEPGLNASIVETVSAWFSNGIVDRALQIGELALAYNAPSDSEVETDTIRFDNFAALEKVAPNPHFIDSVPGKDGTYSVAVSKIAKTAVAFKYQVHLDPAHADSYAPLRIVPAWKQDDNQTLFMLSYSFNSGYSSTGASSVPLSNLILLVHITGNITRCQVSSGGSYAREKNVVYWRVGDVSLADGAPAQVLRARFFTEGDVKTGNVEARWELPGSGSGVGLSKLENLAGASTKEDGEEADPFADEDGERTPVIEWRSVRAVRRLRAGTYVAAASGS